MRFLLIACTLLVVSGCTAFSPSETVFNRTIERAHAADCNIKSLEWTARRTHLECFSGDQANAARSTRGSEHGSDI